MRVYTTLVGFLSLAAHGVARNDVYPTDVPTLCRGNPFCIRAFVLSGTCDSQNGDDTAYVNCVCNAVDAQSILNSCATCAQYYDDDNDNDNDNDVTDLMNDCGWTYISDSAPGATATTGGTTATGIATTTGTIATTATATATTTNSRVTTTGTSVTTSLPSDTTGGSVATTSVAQALAPAHTAMAGSALAGIAMGVLAMM